MSKILAPIALWLALSQNPNALAQQSIQNLQNDYSQRVTELCLDPEVQARLQNPDEICKVSPDGWKTWIVMPFAIATLLGAWFMIRRRRSMSTSTKNPESEATGGPTPESEATGGPTPESEHRTAQSKWENIHQDISYSVNDAHNAKTILRRLISKHRAGYDWSSTPKQTANSAYLNKLLHDLKTQDINKKRITIQVIFAIAKFEKLDNIPNPNKL